MKVVIIGGVAGGATAAARIRRLDEDAEIIILERGSYVSYANCGLPYYIGGEITDKAALTLQSAQSFHQRFRVEVRLRHEAVSIEPDNHAVVVRDLDRGTEYRETYDKLVYSPGAKPLIPDWPGVDDERIFTLRTLDDTFAIDTFIETNDAKTAVVIGAGFIGLEMAENLKRRGLDVTLVQRSDHVLPTLDYDMACEVHHYLDTQGIDLLLKTSVDGFSEHDGKLEVRLAGGVSLVSDLVILAVGVVCDTALAQNAGLALGIKNSVRVNKHMETSAPDIYAVGDAVEITHFVSGQPGLIALAGPANKQGHIAADNICGIESSYTGTQGSSVLKVFDMTIASTGLNEKGAQEAHIDYDRVVLSPASHATYYPGAHNITIKVLFDSKSGLILGAQLIGFEGVDKRCDVFATAIRAKMTAHDLCDLELSYAPPYSSAKDPVNMAGYIMESVLSGRISQFHWNDVAGLEDREDVMLLDVRSAKEFARGHFKDALNIPVDELRERIHELDSRKPLYVNCHSGFRSYIACCILQQQGFTCYNFSGGYRFYKAIDENAKLGWELRAACGADTKL